MHIGLSLVFMANAVVSRTFVIIGLRSSEAVGGPLIVRQDTTDQVCACTLSIVIFTIVALTLLNILFGLSNARIRPNINYWKLILTFISNVVIKKISPITTELN